MLICFWFAPLRAWCLWVLLSIIGGSRDHKPDKGWSGLGKPLPGTQTTRPIGTKGMEHAPGTPKGIDHGLRHLTTNHPRGKELTQLVEFKIPAKYGLGSFFGFAPKPISIKRYESTCPI